MSKLNKLIEELCPDGVETILLGDLFDLRNGYTPSKANNTFWEGGTIPWFRMEDIRTNGRILSDSIQHITPEAIRGGLFPANSIIVATSATIGVHALITVKSLTNQRFVGLSPKVKYKNHMDIKFMFYYFDLIDYWCKGNLNEGNFASVDMKRFIEIPLPLPPLPVQEEIVRILGNFTELTEELTEELTARRKQYEYYRDKLLTFGDEVEWKTLGDVLQATTNIQWGLEDAGTYRYIDLTSVDRDFHYITDTQEINKNNAPSRAKQIVRTGDVIFGTTRPLLKRYCLIDDEYDGQICSTGFSVLRANENIVVQKWVFYHIATSSFYNHVERFEQGASYPAISDANVKRYLIPIPPLAEQERIVSILDKFDALTTDISIGLPAEIKARQKQYEYYRDKLLAFPEKTTDVKGA